MFVQKFSNFDLKFGREVDLDELNNVIKGTFSISPLFWTARSAVTETRALKSEKKVFSKFGRGPYRNG